MQSAFKISKTDNKILLGCNGNYKIFKNKIKKMETVSEQAGTKSKVMVKGVAIAFLVLLLLVYLFVFTILQLQDFALLLSNIGLFISLAAIMHFSKKLQW
jgi:inner membrane protein involved in colicin E2 resistance